MNSSSLGNSWQPNDIKIVFDDNKEVSLAKLEFFSLLRKEIRLRPAQGFSQI